MTSIDRYLSALGSAKADILKIDTEGNDNKVLLGAKAAIRDSLGKGRRLSLHP